MVAIHSKVVGGRTVEYNAEEIPNDLVVVATRFVGLEGDGGSQEGRNADLKDCYVAMMMVCLLLKLSMDIVGSAGVVLYYFFLSAANDDDGWDLKCVKRI